MTITVAAPLVWTTVLWKPLSEPRGGNARTHAHTPTHTHPHTHFIHSLLSNLTGDGLALSLSLSKLFPPPAWNAHSRLPNYLKAIKHLTSAAVMSLSLNLL